MSIFGGFDADTVEPSLPRDLIPDGEYEAVCESVAERENTNRNGSYLYFVFALVGGDHDGRKLFERLNIKNPSEKTVAIANATMSAILRAVGVPRPVNEEDICNIPLVVIVGHKTDNSGNPKYDGTVSNRIVGYRPIEKVASVRVQPLAKAVVGGHQRTEQGAVSKSAPWAKK